MSKLFEKAQRDLRNFMQPSNLDASFTKYSIGERRYLRKIKNNILTFSDGGVPISWNKEKNYVITDNTDVHTLIIGPTASKKSRLIIMPAVKMIASAGESMIITDPKAEIYNRTAAELQKKDYNIKVLNLRDPNLGNAWNPLYIPYRFYCDGDIDRAYEFLNDISKNIISINYSSNEPFWDNSAGALFFGLAALLFKYSKEFNCDDIVVNVGSILKLRNMLCSGDRISIVKNPLWNFAKKDLTIASALIGTIETANDTRSGILSVFDEKMRVFSTQPSLVNMLAYNDIDFGEMEKTKTALYLIMPDEKTTFHGLVSLFIKQSYEYVIFKSQENQLGEDGKLNIRLNYLLDEFSSLPTINDFPAMVTAARSRNVRFNIVIQSKHQLILRYKDETDTILSNCNNWIFLTGRELKFLEEVSALCGTIETSTRERPLISIAELQRLDKDKGEILLLNGRNKPCITCLPDISIYDKNIFKKPVYTRRTEMVATLIEINLDKIKDKLGMSLMPKKSNDIDLKKIEELLNLEKSTHIAKKAEEIKKDTFDSSLIKDIDEYIAQLSTKNESNDKDLASFDINKEIKELEDIFK